MKNPWNDMISLLPLQEFMPLTSVKGKIRASTPCSIFYVNSLHATWILHQVPPKSLCSSICIELIVALASIIPWVRPPLSSISTSTRSVPSYDVALDCSSLDLEIHQPMHYLIRDHAMTLRHLLGPLSFVKILH
ncbi:hypothetical protein GW17_00053579 [Ensete ventricosum]|nr:hypothetical protein GW17_00053579 [Ensete ventricosum]